jgi:hypothetical protein
MYRYIGVAMLNATTLILPMVPYARSSETLDCLIRTVVDDAILVC